MRGGVESAEIASLRRTETTRQIGGLKPAEIGLDDTDQDIRRTPALRDMPPERRQRLREQMKRLRLMSPDERAKLLDEPLGEPDS